MPTTVYEVAHDSGAAARFSELSGALSYAKGKTHGGVPARIRQFEIPEGSERLWGLDALHSVRRPGPETERDEVPRMPEPEPKAKSPRRSSSSGRYT